MADTCLVIGAGFSKAISNLPVTSEMINRFKEELGNQREKGNKCRIKEGQDILNFIDDVENKYKESIGENENNSNGKFFTNIPQNFEGICSYIDLNITSDGHSFYEINGSKKDLPSKSQFSNCTSNRLRNIRRYIGDYLYYILIEDKIEDKTNQLKLNSFYDKFINGCNSIITFNYDLILEKFLYKKGKWFPKDGYGFIPLDLPEIKPNYVNQQSKVKIFKMHGSLNWEPYSKDINPYEGTDKNLQLRWVDIVNNNIFFPDYLVKDEKINFLYRNGINSQGWVFPSWLKQFSYWEMLQTWNNASKSLTNADEVIFIGYSLPKADSVVCSLFSTIDWDNKKVQLYDFKAKELLKKYSFILRKNDIEIFEGKLENYL